jgi:putative ABC transport system permease protein
MNAEPLSLLDLSAAAVLLLVNGALSWAFRLGLGRSMAIAAARMAAQLGAVGFVLKITFEQNSPFLTAALALAMILVAGLEVVMRQDQRPGWLAVYGVGTGTLFLVGLVATTYTLTAIIGPTPWYAPRYALPILGMILGNCLTGVALVLNTLMHSAARERAAIEARIALGATRFEALAIPLVTAIRTGMMPILNAMAVSGLVSLPGMMTGQILAGAEPIQAAKYQIVIMFVLSGATSLGVTIAAICGAYLLTDARHRLRLDRMTVT